MRRARRLAIGAMAVCGLLGIAAALAAALGVGASSRPGWRRVFFDDFNHGLRTSRWGVYSGQPGGDPGGWWAPSHAVVTHGMLHLETYRDPSIPGGYRRYTPQLKASDAATLSRRIQALQEPLSRIAEKVATAG